MFLENQAKGGYKVLPDPGDYGGDMIIKFNLSYEADPEIGKWFNTADFRRALSLGIDRDQINETFWLGTGTPGSVVPADNNKYNPGPQYRKLWATLDVKKANEMLDKVGLAKKDAEGFRLRTDGKGRLRIEIMTLGGQFLQFTQIAEMIREQWKKIGIDLIVQEVERSLALKRTAANEQQLGAWNNDGSEHLFTFPLHVFPFEIAAVASSGPLYARWFQSAGAQGKEPPARMKELMEKFKRAYGVPEKERIELGKEVWKIAAEEVYIIGVIGMGPAPWACAWSRRTWATFHRGSTTARTARRRHPRRRHSLEELSSGRRGGARLHRAARPCSPSHRLGYPVSRSHHPAPPGATAPRTSADASMASWCRREAQQLRVITASSTVYSISEVMKLSSSATSGVDRWRRPVPKSSVTACG